MKVREDQVMATCEGCGAENKPCNIVTWEMAETIKLLCNDCLEFAKEVLDLVDVKEAEA